MDCLKTNYFTICHYPLVLFIISATSTLTCYISRSVNVRNFKQKLGCRSWFVLSFTIVHLIIHSIEHLKTSTSKLRFVVILHDWTCGARYSKQSFLSYYIFYLHKATIIFQYYWILNNFWFIRILVNCTILLICKWYIYRIKHLYLLSLPKVCLNVWMFLLSWTPIKKADLVTTIDTH